MENCEVQECVKKPLTALLFYNIISNDEKLMNSK